MPEPELPAPPARNAALAPLIAPKIARLALAPLALYAALFAVLTWPMPLSFRSGFWTTLGDGSHMIWNLWWVDKALRDPSLSVFFTRYIEFPYGTTLLAHSLHPFNGLLASPLLSVLSMREAFNAVTFFCYAASGLAAFWLALRVTGSYAGSLLAGAIFAFSPYHFSHGESHLNLLAAEWIPVFALFWLEFLRAPRAWNAGGSAASLFLALLCDHYYFIYCFLFALLAFARVAYVRRDALYLFSRASALPTALFLALSAATSGALAVAYLLANSRDPFLGAHDPLILSTDLLAPFIPGDRWRFGEWTRGYWSRLPITASVISPYFGWSVLALAALAFLARRGQDASETRFWFSIAVLFTALSLGPKLQIAGRVFDFPPMPYQLLEVLVPPLKQGGVPDRLMVVATLAAAVLAAFGWKRLAELARPGPLRWAPALLLAVLFIEYLPKHLPVSEPVTPGYVEFLRDYAEPGAVADTVMSGGLAMYYQTIHGRPMSFGYTARTPASVLGEQNRLHEAILEFLASGDGRRLRDQYKFRLITIDASEEFAPRDPLIRRIYADTETLVFDLGESSAAGGAAQ